MYAAVMLQLMVAVFVELYIFEELSRLDFTIADYKFMLN